MITTSQLTKEANHGASPYVNLHPSAHKYSVKYVKAGNHVEVYEYKTKARTTCVSGRKVAIASRAGRNRPQNVYRSQSEVKRLINANHGKWPEEDKFITLTSDDEHVTEDLSEACRQLDRFLKRLRYYYPGKWTYVAVPEIQHNRYEKYGVKAIHWHLATFGLPYIENSKLRSIWKQGFVRINKQHDFENPGMYLAAYMGKDFIEEEFKGHRRYLTGQALRRYSEGTGQTVDEVLVSQGITEECLVYEKTYNNNPYMGEVHYMRYNLRKIKQQKEGGTNDSKEEFQSNTQAEGCTGSC